MTHVTTTEEQRLNEAIARSIERCVKYVAEQSLDYDPAKVESVRFAEDGIFISISLQFLLPEDSAERNELKLYRDNFATYVMKAENERRLSNLLYEILVESIVEPDKKQHWSPDILRRLKRISQRALAGRPRKPIPEEIRERVRDEGRSTYRSIIELQAKVKRWKARGPLDDQTIKRKLRRAYPSNGFPWIKDFLDLDGTIPRRRNSDNPDPGSDFAENANAEGRLPPCKLSQPEHWSPLDSAVKVMQKKLDRESQIIYPLLEIKRLIKQ